VKQRSSGLSVPDTLPDEYCGHKDVDRIRGVPGYKCRECKQKVYLVTTGQIFMTPEELQAWKQGVERRAGWE